MLNDRDGGDSQELELHTSAALRAALLLCEHFIKRRDLESARRWFHIAGWLAELSGAAARDNPRLGLGTREV